MYILFLLSFVGWSSITDDDTLNSQKNTFRSLLLSFVAILLAIDGLLDYCRDKFKVSGFLGLLMTITTVIIERSKNEFPRSYRRLLGVNLMFALAQLLYYARGFTNIAALVQLIFAVITDMGPFFIRMCVFIIGLAHSVGVHQLGWDDLRLNTDETARHFTTALRDIALMSVLGDLEIADYNTGFTSSLAVFTIVIMSIVMLNLLIAIISETYERVRALQVSTINKARAELVDEMERTFLQWIPSFASTSISDKLTNLMTPAYLIVMAPDDAHMRQAERSTEVGKLRIQLREQSKQLGEQEKQLKILSRALQNDFLTELSELKKGQQHILAALLVKEKRLHH